MHGLLFGTSNGRKIINERKIIEADCTPGLPKGSVARTTAKSN